MNEINQNELQIWIGGASGMTYLPTQGDIIQLLPDNKLIFVSGKYKSYMGLFRNINDKYEFLEKCKKAGVIIDDTTL